MSGSRQWLKHAHTYMGLKGHTVLWAFEGFVHVRLCPLGSAANTKPCDYLISPLTTRRQRIFALQISFMTSVV